MHYFFPIEPVAKGRPKFCSRGGRVWGVTPAKTRHAEDELARMLVNVHQIPPAEGALSLTLIFKLRKPKKIKRSYPISRPDLDNYIKLVMDAANEILWKDDSQIVCLSALKSYADNENEIGIDITVTQMESEKVEG